MADWRIRPTRPEDTEILARLSDTRDFAMLLMGKELKVIHVTTHVALRRVPDLVTRERVLGVGKLRVFIDGEASFCAALRDALFTFKTNTKNPNSALIASGPSAP